MIGDEPIVVNAVHDEMPEHETLVVAMEVTVAGNAAVK